MACERLPLWGGAYSIFEMVLLVSSMVLNTTSFPLESGLTNDSVADWKASFVQRACQSRGDAESTSLVITTGLC